jgi:hypothetical protein
MPQTTEEMIARAEEMIERVGPRTKPIPTSVHGVADYSLGSMLMLASGSLGFAEGPGIASSLPRAMGAGALLYSLLTRYELGVVPVLPMRAHIALDMISGALLAASPLVFGFARRNVRTWLPHVAVGIGEVLLAAFSDDRSL